MKVIIYKSFKRIYSLFFKIIERILCLIKLQGNNVKYSKFSSSGVPYIMVARGGNFKIGNLFAMHNGIKGNPIGCYSKCTFFVDSKAELTIGNNVGISQTAIICHKKIIIGNEVKIGGGVKIYDTDFHALDPEIRNSNADLDHKVTAPVIIGNRVFIGAYSIILKGVVIGENSIIGAGSIVTKSVPPNQIWAGNPAKFIKEL